MYQEKLTKNFRLSEFTHSQLATRNGIDNAIPSEDIYNNIRLQAQCMEDIRKLLKNKPIIVSSGYRSEKLNKAVGGTPTSAHLKGLAVDFTCPAYGDPRSIFDRIKDNYTYDKLIIGAIGNYYGYDQLILEYNNWIHISFLPWPHGQRNQNLYFDGKVYNKV